VRVHRKTTDFRTSAQPTAATCLTYLDQLMVAVAHNTDCCAASFEDVTNFTGCQTDRYVFSILFTKKLRFDTSRTHKFSTLAWLEFNVVDQRTYRNVFKR